MSAKSDLNQLFDLSKEVSNISPSQITNAALKVSEESGEMAAEVLKLIGHKKTSLKKDDIIIRIKEESVDTIIAVLDVLNVLNTSKEEIVALGTKALEKWKKKHLKTKL